MAWLRDLSSTLSPGQPLYVMMYAAAIIFFCFFYTALVFNPKEMADNLKKSGAFIPGIRPGDQTARYIDGVMTRLTVAGAIYITAVCLLPEFLILQLNVPFYFGGSPRFRTGASYFYYQLSKSYKVVNLNQIKLNISKRGIHFCGTISDSQYTWRRRRRKYPTIVSSLAA